MLFNQSLLLTAAFLLSACATSIENHDSNEKLLKHSEARLNETEACCSSFDSLDYIPLQQGDKNKTTVGGEGKVREFSDKRNFYTAFELPKASSRARLKVKTSLSGIIGRGDVFYPSLVFLNKDFHEVRRIVNPGYYFKKKAGTLFLEKEFPVNVGERYVVLLMDGKKARKEMKYLLIEKGEGMMLLPGGGAYSFETSEREIFAPLNKFQMEISMGDM